MRSLVAGLFSLHCAVRDDFAASGRAAAEEKGKGGGKAVSRTGGVRKASK